MGEDITWMDNHPNLLEDVEDEMVSECTRPFCLDKYCKLGNCSRVWKNRKSRKVELNTQETEICGIELGVDKSITLIQEYVSMKKDINFDYKKEYQQTDSKRRKKKKKQIKKDPRKRKKSSIRNQKYIKPFLQNYTKKWEKVMNQNGHKFRNCLLLNPLILSRNLESNSTKKAIANPKIPFPSYNSMDYNSQKTSDSTNIKSSNMNPLVNARPRYTLQLRRKSSLIALESSAPKLNPIVIELCREYQEFGYCKNSGECLNLHNFNKNNKYQHLLSRFVNRIIDVMSNNMDLANVLNNFHSLHPTLDIFHKLLYRRPETCIFELLK